MDKKQMIRKAIKAHNIDVPIMKTRLVGNRLEMYLYGGKKVIYEQGTPDLTKTQHDDAPIELKDQSLTALRKMAKAEGIKGYSSVKKAVLVELLAKV